MRVRWWRVAKLCAVFAGAPFRKARMEAHGGLKPAPVEGNHLNNPSLGVNGEFLFENCRMPRKTPDRHVNHYIAC